MQPKGRKIALVSDNEISKVWAKFVIDSSIFLQMIIGPPIIEILTLKAVCIFIYFWSPESAGRTYAFSPVHLLVC